MGGSNFPKKIMLPPSLGGSKSSEILKVLPPEMGGSWGGGFPSRISVTGGFPPSQKKGVVYYSLLENYCADLGTHRNTQNKPGTKIVTESSDIVCAPTCRARCTCSETIIIQHCLKTNYVCIL